MDAYERVLSDALAGDTTLFAREDYVEEAWRIVDPVLAPARRFTTMNREHGARCKRTKRFCRPADGTLRRCLRRCGMPTKRRREPKYEH